MRWIRHLASEVARNHSQGTAGQVPQPVRQIRVVALHQRIKRERAVLAENYFAQQEVSQRVGAENVEHGFRADDIPARLRHLVLFKQEPTVGDDCLGKRQAGSHQKCRPIDAVKADDFFADHVQIGRPILFVLGLVIRAVSERSDVVGKRVEPDIDHVLRIVRNRNAPLEGGTAHREIAQSASNKRNYFVAARFRADEVRLFGIELEKLVFKGGKLEEIILFLHSFGWPAAFRTGSARADNVYVELVVNAVLAGIRPLVDVTIVTNNAPERLYSTFVPLRGGPNKVIVRQAHAIPQHPELIRNFVGKLLWRLVGSLGGSFNFLAVFVGPGQKKGIVSEHAVATRDRVAGDRRVRVPDVRPRIHVVNRGRNVKLLAHLWPG